MVSPVSEPDFIDAKFKPIRPRRRWVLTLDWRNFLIVAAIALAAGARAFLEQ
jgi:hypothetical protein